MALHLISDTASVHLDGPSLAESGGREVALPGMDLRPGIVDLHGDGFERHLAPRRGANVDLGQGLVAVDAELAANGITTAFLAVSWSWEGGQRSPDFAKRLLAALDAARPTLMTDIRVQLRLETAMIDTYDDLAATVAAHAVPVVVFNDHLPHDDLARGKAPPVGQALKAGRSPEAHTALLRDLHARRADVPRLLAPLARRLAARGVLIGSHDDATPEGRAAFRALGAPLAEFPETEAAARAARAGGDPIVMGAPNAVRGASHKRNVSARALVQAGLVDALVSDYHYPALRIAGDLCGWDLVSAGPARVAGLDDRGRLTPGRRADLTVTEVGGGRVLGTMVAGRWSYMTAPLFEALTA
ncbi:MAG: alpha-D-ribose 1-methylphosphonate 5-triphosphate diphosphatase [Shimia sp.]